MKKRETTCPGCGRHCTAENVGCKYGRNYFEKLSAAEPEGMAHRKYKWERYVEEQGILRKLLMLSVRMKKALKSGRMTEEQLTGALTGEEKEWLAAAISKMEETMKKAGSDV